MIVCTFNHTIELLRRFIEVKVKQMAYVTELKLHSAYSHRMNSMNHRRLSTFKRCVT